MIGPALHLKAPERKFFEFASSNLHMGQKQYLCNHKIRYLPQEYKAFEKRWCHGFSLPLWPSPLKKQQWRKLHQAVGASGVHVSWPSFLGCDGVDYQQVDACFQWQVTSMVLVVTLEQDGWYWMAFLISSADKWIEGRCKG